MPQADEVAGRPADRPLPEGTVIAASAPVEGTQLPADTTAWLVTASKTG